MEQMLKQDDRNAVAVITPPGLHKSQSVAAMEAGKHVFCEKPMALTVTDCNQMLEAVKRTGKALQIGTQRRHSNDRSEEHTSELQSLMRISYAVFCLKKKKTLVHKMKIQYTS